MKPKQMDLVLNQLHVKNLGISRSLIGAHCWASGRVFEGEQRDEIQAECQTGEANCP